MRLNGVEPSRVFPTHKALNLGIEGDFSSIQRSQAT